jgi:hypothetical protein
VPGPQHPLGRLRDVDGVIAHPLQVVRDLHHGGEKSQVARHGLLGRQQVDHLLLDFQLDVIDRVVARDDLARLVGVALQHRVDGAVQRGLRLARHVEQHDLELGELVVKMAVTRRWCVHPNLPVM